MSAPYKGRPTATMITVTRHGAPVQLMIDGLVAVEYGEDARGDTYRYRATITRIEEAREVNGRGAAIAFDDSLSPDEQERAEGALCDSAHRQAAGWR